MNRSAAIGFMILAAEQEAHLPAEQVERLVRGMVRQFKRNEDGYLARDAVWRYADLIPVEEGGELQDGRSS
ncbi:hypothetical protein NYE69_06755 [Paenibacillus sp. FSL R5-0527]|uniref:hypothetical protein n=1 Tax=Paenibacillus sp. FSL R5-0527 TaxID=2975321 RepID=UPI00097B0925|nr:hypothetical protein BK140_09165 [Paenibacillus macerans]